eukprot:gene3670-4583_t
MFTTSLIFFVYITGRLYQSNLKLLSYQSEKDDLIAALRSDGYAVEDMSDNETAKLHVRHMVGGRATGLPHERILRFEFPERPGAFLRFLNSLKPAWALTLFHYRNHGDDVGRVLAGISVPPAEQDALTAAGLKPPSMSAGTKQKLAPQNFVSDLLGKLGLGG